MRTFQRKRWPERKKKKDHKIISNIQKCQIDKWVFFCLRASWLAVKLLLGNFAKRQFWIVTRSLYAGKTVREKTRSLVAQGRWSLFAVPFLYETVRARKSGRWKQVVAIHGGHWSQVLPVHTNQLAATTQWIYHTHVPCSTSRASKADTKRFKYWLRAAERDRYGLVSTIDIVQPCINYSIFVATSFKCSFYLRAADVQFTESANSPKWHPTFKQIEQQKRSINTANGKTSFTYFTWNNKQTLECTTWSVWHAINH